jgi:hypothetical protein
MRYATPNFKSICAYCFPKSRTAVTSLSRMPPSASGCCLALRALYAVLACVALVGSESIGSGIDVADFTVAISSTKFAGGMPLSSPLTSLLNFGS